jgi:hypothetical protein
MLKPSYANAVS